MMDISKMAEHPSIRIWHDGEHVQIGIKGDPQIAGAVVMFSAAALVHKLGMDRDLAIAMFTRAFDTVLVEESAQVNA